MDGIGGIGKTALAIEAAHRAQDTSLFDAFVFVTAKQNILAPSGIRELAPAARTLDDFLNETARVLGQIGIPKLSSDKKRRALLEALRATRALLIYDNLETLSKEEQEQMADFLRELPQACKAIITSRRRGGEGAVWLRVEKLDWDAARGIIENEMARDAGLATKLRRAESRWQELYDETNGSPLALVHTLGLMRVRTALTFDGALEMLRGNRDADLQQFIFQEARKELTTNDKTALGALSFFVPSATFEAWMQVANLSRNALETTIDRLSALSLVDVLAGEERYALHPLTRAFVRDELLADANVARETGMRFGRYWVDFVHQYGSRSRNYPTFNLVEAEWANIDATIGWLLESVTFKTGMIEDDVAAQIYVRLARELERFLRFSERWDEHIRINEQAYEIACILSSWRDAGWCARATAWTYYYRAQIEDATRWAKKCEAAWARGGNANEKTVAMKLLGTLAKQRKDYSDAERLFKQVLEIRRNLRDDKGIAIIHTDLGELAQEQGKFDEAERYYLEGLKWAQKKQDKPRQSSRMATLGQLALERERFDGARKWFEQALVLAQEIGRQDEIARIKKGLARVHEAEGRADLALPLAQSALKIYERMQHKDLAAARELVERLTNSTNEKRINE